AFPFSSSFYLEEVGVLAQGEGGEEEEDGRGEAGSGRTVTGYRVAFGEHSLPFTRGRVNIPPGPLNEMDGFSTLAPILFYLEGMSSSNLVGPGDPGASLSINSTTWLIEVPTGELIPHFVEIDALDPEEPLAVLQPAQPLRHGTRHVVAVVGAEGAWGERLRQTPGFAELLEAVGADRETPVHPTLRARARHFSRFVFPALRKVG
ncbi:unnamed protein product, partial [Choristocarpus tenellus]